MTHSLYVVAIKIENERCIIVGMIDRTNAGSAVVATACRERGLMEGVDLRPILGDEAHMKVRSGFAVRTDPQFGLFIAAKAAGLRLRPILMTSFAFILGVVPLVLATGAGAEQRVALGVAVFSGMIGVTVIGLVLTPVFYVLARAVSARLPKRVVRAHGTPAE